MRIMNTLILGFVVCGAGCAIPSLHKSTSSWEQLHMAASEGNLVGTMQILKRGATRR